MSKGSEAFKDSLILVINYSNCKILSEKTLKHKETRPEFSLWFTEPSNILKFFMALQLHPGRSQQQAKMYLSGM